MPGASQAPCGHGLRGWASQTHPACSQRLHLYAAILSILRRRMVNISTPDVRAYVTQRQADGAANGTINRKS